MIERINKSGNRPFKLKPCSNCGSLTHTSQLCLKKARKPWVNKTQLKATKPMRAKGKKTIEYEKWRDQIAKPFLDKNFGHICSVEDCDAVEGLQVDHIRNRGSRADLKMNLTNVQYLCVPHHEMKTYHIKPKEGLDL